jgi:hypothetical protein
VNGRSAIPFAVANSGEELTILIRGTASRDIPSFVFAVGVYCDDKLLFSMHDDANILNQGQFEVSFAIPAQFLRPGTFSISLAGRQINTGDCMWAKDAATLEILPNWSRDYREENIGLVNIPTQTYRVNGAPTAHPKVEVT